MLSTVASSRVVQMNGRPGGDVGERVLGDSNGGLRPVGDPGDPVERQAMVLPTEQQCGEERAWRRFMRAHVDAGRKTCKLNRLVGKGVEGGGGRESVTTAAIYR